MKDIFVAKEDNQSIEWKRAESSSMFNYDI